MKILYISRNKLFTAWILVGTAIFMLLFVSNKQLTMLDAFSSPINEKLIVIDPGHGGFDSGAVSPSGTREDELNLIVAKKLKQYLMEHNAIVILTRETNEALAEQKADDMRKRLEIIRDSNPDIVISIHMNKFPQTQYFGGQTFYMTGSEEGKNLAQSIQIQLLDNLIDENKRQIKAVDNFLVLKAGKAPAVLVECGFLSNPKEEELLKTDAYQDKIAWSIFNGIIDYFAANELMKVDGSVNNMS